MKTLFLIPVLAILIASCSKNDTTSDPAADLTTNTNLVVQNNWVVTQYAEGGVDKTSDFAGYTFKFNADGSLVSVLADSTYKGTWVFGTGTSTYYGSGSSSDDKSSKFIINIAGTNLLDHLSHKWLNLKLTATEIWLSDDNVASNEILRFGK
jgi:hypothetical protein